MNRSLNAEQQCAGLLTIANFADPDGVSMPHRPHTRYEHRMLGCRREKSLIVSHDVVRHRG